METKTKIFFEIFAGALIAFAVANLGIIDFAFASLTAPPQGLCGPFPCPEGDTGVQMATGLVGRVVDNVRYIIGAIAILLIIVSGIKLVMSQGNEEVYSKQVSTILYSIVGLFIIGLAGEIASVFEVDRGGFLSDPNVSLQKSQVFSRTVEIVMTFIKYIIGSVSVLFIVRNGLILITSGEKEEELSKTKKNIFYGFLGLIIIMMANPIINNIFFKIDTSKYPGTNPVKPGIDTKALMLEVAGITNIIAAITGPFAILSLVVGGLMYILAGENDERLGKAKKIIIWSLVGILLIYGAFAIVSTVILRKFEGL
jgi:hypothetical protein